MNNHTITCKIEVNALKILDYDENGCPITTGISTIVERKMNQEVTDNEYEAITNALMMRENKYYTVYLEDIPGCEWMFHRVVNKDWQNIVRRYDNMNVEHTIKHPNLYRIELPNDMLIAPSVQVLSLQPMQPKLDFDKIPEKTIFNKLPDGSLEVVKAGLDFPSFRGTGVDELNLIGISSNSNRSKETFPINEITRVGERAFENSDLLEISLPNCKEIERNAFSGCPLLRKVHMPKLERIGMFAFTDCHFLSWFTYPSSIKNISDGAFYGCIHLKGFLNGADDLIRTLPEGTKVGEDAFAYTPLDFLSDNPIYDPSIPEDEE